MFLASCWDRGWIAAVTSKPNSPYSGETVTLWLSRPTDLAKSSALRAPCSGGAGGAIVSGAGNAGGTDGSGRASQDLVLSRASAREREGDHSAWLVTRRDGRPLTAPKWTQASRPTALFMSSRHPKRPAASPERLPRLA